jgi:type I restriction enzyme, S subunit
VRSLKPYPEYKSTEDIFIAIPTTWQSERLLNVAELKTSNVDKKSVEGKRTVNLCNYVDVYYHKKITSTIDFMAATASENEINRFALYEGEVVFTKDSEDPFDIGIPTYISEEINDLVCGYHLTILRPFSDKLLGEYAYYALEAEISKHQFTLASNGVTRFGLTAQGTKNLRICVPTLSEQTQIAKFLDYKTAQIDSLIEKKKALIEKLEEKRIALITQAVTKGLNPVAPMKDSGVEWLGEVPEHWEVRKLRYFLKTVATGTTPPTAEPKYYEDPNVAWYTPADFNDKTINLTSSKRKINIEAINDGINKKFLKNSVLVVGIGATLGRVGKVNSSFCCNQQINVLVPENLIDTSFLALSLSVKTDVMKVISNATTLGIMNQEKTKTLEICAPSITEQSQIASFLDQMINETKILEEKIELAIKYLTEYRSSLITAAVTGKIDVRDFHIK